MGIMDLSYRQSFCFPPHCASACMEPGLLYLGGGCWSFLFPELPSLINLDRLKQARMILFKIPEESACPAACLPDRYCVYPLVDFFSIYGYCYALPGVDEGLGAAFCDDPCRCVIEIDVTGIVQAWLRGSPENYGLMLGGGTDTRRLACASCFHEIPGMRPILRLVYEDVPISQPLSAMDCIVTIKT